MTRDEFETVRALLHATGEVLDGIRSLCLRHPDTTPADVRALLERRRDDLAGLIDVVQNRIRADWEDRQPPQTVVRRAPRVTKPLESSDLIPNAAVVRHDMNGRRPDDLDTPPPRVGRWQIEVTRDRVSRTQRTA